MESRELLIETFNNEIRVAVLECNILVDFIVERENRSSVVGDIYMGRVEKILPSIGAAFVDIGIKKSGFLPLLEHDKEPNQVLKPIFEGASICVQVKRDAFSQKGPQLSQVLSFVGRLLVFIPGNGQVSISRQINDVEESKRLRRLVEKIKEPGEGFVVRTLAEGSDVQTIRTEIKKLKKFWKKVKEVKNQSCSPKRIYKDLGALKKILRDYTQGNITEIKFNDVETYKNAKEFCKQCCPDIEERLEICSSGQSLFAKHEIEEEIEKALGRFVSLKSGGGLVIEKTEALTAIDVNSGSFIQAENPLQNARLINLEAASEIARQIRIRNIGGIIIVDFIHMNEDIVWEEVIQKLRAEFAFDRVSCRVLDKTAGGLVEIIRRRRRPALTELLQSDCPSCEGGGKIFNTESVLFEILREIRREAEFAKSGPLILNASPEIIRALEDAHENSYPFSGFPFKIIQHSVEEFRPNQFEIFFDGTK